MVNDDREELFATNKNEGSCKGSCKGSIKRRRTAIKKAPEGASFLVWNND
tara:strand:- start:253 stop:402 length:150 start_codon:yes stop_codon:yes gene_type:complete